MQQVEKQVEAVMRVTIHTIEGITRDTDVGSDPDPFVEVGRERVKEKESERESERGE